MVAQVAGAGARPRLSLARVLDTAVGLIERDGAHALSMRQLGRELGVEAMALYRYVANYQDLLDGLVDRVVDSMLDRPEMQSAADDDWRAFLTTQAHGVRSIATQTPALFPLLATHPPAAPWIRPPVRSLRWIEEFLAGLLTRGFAEDGAAAAYRIFTSFLLGHLLLEVSGRGVPTSPGLEPEPDPTRNTTAGRRQLARYPAVARLAGTLGQDNPDREFQAALTAVLDRLEHLNALPSPTALG